ncbi:MAG: histidinol dehydrogenase [Geminicoccaceae bacterium]|nr:histidinol dehydrogenase [Geminicoccaceae bacterium]MDW8339869.1 histidinol dehydrogenase [Geminicoccaceae bacterium]
MPLRLDTRDPGFAAAFDRLVESRREERGEVREEVAAILARVRDQGDAALLEFTRRFDRLALPPSELRIPPRRLAEARDRLDPELRAALELAAARIRAYHERQLPADLDWRDELGVQLGLRWQPIEAVGLYVPGGTAAYPSSVLMNAIPARVAGCRRLVVTVPTPEGKVNEAVLAAAAIAGVDEVYRVGGAQAIAALAFGTETIAPVDKIVGPGNLWVAEAKRQVFGRVGIDALAGPSEVVVVADDSADPAWVAADLLAQAEHDERAQAVLLTDDAHLAEAVAAEVERQLARLDRAAIARASWQAHGAILLLRTLEEAPALVDRLAPEHLQLCVREPAALAARVRRAGAIFLGHHTPEVIGDYVGGPNHVLPTGRSARFASGLSVFDFLTRTTLLGCSEEALRALAPSAIALARAEGLPAHARAVALRLGARV